MIQKKKGFLIFLIEQELNTNEIKFLENEIVVYFKSDINFEIKTKQSIGLQNEKQKSFISYI